MKIKDIPICERPRERLLKYGASYLSNNELLSIILKNGRKGESVTELSNEILKNIKDISELKKLNKNDLLKIKGIGNAKTAEVLAVIELGRRIFLEKPISKKIIFNNSKKIYEYNKHLFKNKDQEYFYCIYLNSKKEMIERKLLFMGTLNRSVVHPREIFKEAYLMSASSIICMHNHPSGDTKPSIDDIRFTKSLMEIGTLQQIPIVDHLIFGDNSYYSFYENNINVR